MRTSKYNARKVTLDGHRFDSKKEAGRYMQLKMLERVGEISGLELQPRFELQGKFRYKGETIRKVEYVADFRYVDKDGRMVVEDIKGYKTDVYQLKRKLFLGKYGESIDFREI